MADRQSEIDIDYGTEAGDELYEIPLIDLSEFYLGLLIFCADNRYPQRTKSHQVLDRSTLIGRAQNPPMHKHALSTALVPAAAAHRIQISS